MLSRYRLAVAFLAALCCSHQSSFLPYATAEDTNVDTETNDSSADDNADDTSSTSSKSYSWDYLLRESISQENPIIANGNIFPPPPNDHENNCLLLLTNSQIMRHCPELDNLESGGSTKIVYKRPSSHIRGIFVLPEYEEDKNRAWFLSTPGRLGFDYIEELDTVLGEVKQALRVPGTHDAHDLILSDGTIFIADTRTGNVVNLELPKPKTGKFNFLTGHYLNKTMGKPDSQTIFQPAELIRNYTAFTRSDHVNNIALHKDIIFTSLHGADGLKPKVKSGPTVVDGELKEKVTKEEQARTRLTALERNLEEKFGRELNKELDGFEAVDNMGMWCHGIAFWEEKSDDPNVESKIKLIGLDSKAGGLASVVVSGPGADVKEREVLWLPDNNHPVVRPPPPPKGAKPDLYKNMTAFSKGLAVQGDIAYFGVSAARKFREHINPTLLVAVNLKTKEEVFVRSIETKGVINQVVTEAYLGYQLVVGKKEEKKYQAEKKKREEEEAAAKAEGASDEL